MLTPPEQFGIIEKGVYRSDMLHPSHLPFIKALRLKTTLVLSPEVPNRAVTNFLEDNNIKLFHLGLSVWKPNLGWRPVSEELIKDGLEMALDVGNHPILVMCTSGVHETGTFVGCLRKLQNWSFSSIVAEYRSYAGNKVRYVNEQFIELFDMDLITLPHNLPSWFVEQRILWVTITQVCAACQDLNLNPGFFGNFDKFLNKSTNCIHVKKSCSKCSPLLVLSRKEC